MLFTSCAYNEDRNNPGKTWPLISKVEKLGQAGFCLAETISWGWTEIKLSSKNLLVWGLHRELCSAACSQLAALANLPYTEPNAQGRVESTCTEQEQLSAPWAGFDAQITLQGFPVWRWGSPSMAQTLLCSSAKQGASRSCAAAVLREVPCSYFADRRVFQGVTAGTHSCTPQSASTCSLCLCMRGSRYRSGAPPERGLCTSAVPGQSTEPGLTT